MHFKTIDEYVNSLPMIAKDAWQHRQLKENGESHNAILAEYGQQIFDSMMAFSNQPPKVETKGRKRVGLLDLLARAIRPRTKNITTSDAKAYRSFSHFVEQAAQGELDAFLQFVSELGDGPYDANLAEKGRRIYESVVKTPEDRGAVAAVIDLQISHAKQSEDFSDEETRQRQITKLLWAQQRILGMRFADSFPEEATQLIRAVKREQVFSQTYRIVVQGTPK